MVTRHAIFFKFYQLYCSKDFSVDKRPQPLIHTHTHTHTPQGSSPLNYLGTMARLGRHGNRPGGGGGLEQLLHQINSDSGNPSPPLSPLAKTFRLPYTPLSLSLYNSLSNLSTPLCTPFELWLFLENKKRPPLWLTLVLKVICQTCLITDKVFFNLLIFQTVSDSMNHKKDWKWAWMWKAMGILCPYNNSTSSETCTTYVTSSQTCHRTFMVRYNMLKTSWKKNRMINLTFPNWSKYCLTSSMVVFTDRPPTKIFLVRVTNCRRTYRFIQGGWDFIQ